jgi:hypothetical protein
MFHMHSLIYHRTYKLFLDSVVALKKINAANCMQLFRFLNLVSKRLVELLEGKTGPL